MKKFLYNVFGVVSAEDYNNKVLYLMQKQNLLRKQREQYREVARTAEAEAEVARQAVEALMKLIADMAGVMESWQKR